MNDVYRVTAEFEMTISNNKKTTGICNGAGILIESNKRKLVVIVHE